MMIPGASLFAQAGSGILLGEGTVLTPSVSLTVNHSDNVNLTARAEGVDIGGTLKNSNSDTYFTQTAALNLDSQGGAFQWSGRTWYTNSAYDKFGELDNQTYGVAANGWVTSATGRTTLNVGLDWQHAIDSSEVFPDLNDTLISNVQVVSQRSERDEYRSNVDLSHAVTDKITGTLGYGYTYTDFKDNTYRDFTDQNVSGTISYALSEFLNIYFTTGSHYIDQEKSSTEDLEYFSGWEDPYFTVGINADRPMQLTDKITFNVSAGYVTRSQVEQDGSRETTEESKVALAGNLNYAISPKTTFSLGARSGLETESTPGSSLRDSTTVDAALTNQISNRLTHRASIGWRKDDYLDPLPTTAGFVDEKKETVVYSYDINFTTLRPWLSLFGSLKYEDGSSEIPDDNYTETLVSAGVTLRY